MMLQPPPSHQPGVVLSRSAKNTGLFELFLLDFDASIIDVSKYNDSLDTSFKIPPSSQTDQAIRKRCLLLPSLVRNFSLRLSATRIQLRLLLKWIRLVDLFSRCVEAGLKASAECVAKSDTWAAHISPPPGFHILAPSLPFHCACCGFLFGVFGDDPPPVIVLLKNSRRKSLKDVAFGLSFEALNSIV